MHRSPGMHAPFATTRLEPQLTRSLEHLWNVPFPPPELYIQGSEQALKLLTRLPERGLAVVGTRRPRPRSLGLVGNWIHELRNSELIIISGLASGIDTAAHQAALDNGLPTIAVLGCGFEHLYPRENAVLAAEILRADGLLVSEFSPGTKPLPGYFIHRNRLIANWTKATWIVEAGFRSGALNTAKWARLSNRFCFTTPGFPGDPALAGNQSLLEQDLSHAIWGPHGFGTAWLELSGLGQKSVSAGIRGNKRKQPKQYETGDLGLLCSELRRLTAETGGAPVSELLNWALEKGWEPARFFIAFRTGLDSGSIEEQNGIFLKRREASQ